MLALLLEREVFVPRLPAAAPDAAARAAAEPRDSWMGVYLPGRQRVGWIHTRTGPESREDVPGARMILDARLRLTVLGEPADIRLSGDAWSTLDGQSTDFAFAMVSGPHDLRIRGEVEGGFLTGEVHTAGEVMPLRIPMEGNPLFSGGLGAFPNIPPLEPGQQFLIDTFDPLTLSAAPARLSYLDREEWNVDGRTVPATVVRVEASGLESKVWVTDDGEVIRAETPYGFTLARISAAEAAEAIDPGAVTTDLITALAVQPRGMRPFRGARHMAFQVSGLDPEVLLPTDEDQQARGEMRYVVTLPEAPHPGESYAALDDSERAPALAGDALLPVDHPRIVEEARRIVGDETDPWRQALAIYTWVYENIEKRAVLSVPSALDVLDTRQGDCNEHTVLFTALARAVGLPTRIALGVVWSEELNGFYYHAWPEVYAGRWVRMDPTLGQPLADATHVKLATGDVAEWARILPYLGRLQIDVTDIH